MYHYSLHIAKQLRRRNLCHWYSATHSLPNPQWHREIGAIGTATARRHPIFLVLQIAFFPLEQPTYQHLEHTAYLEGLLKVRGRFKIERRRTAMHERLRALKRIIIAPKYHLADELAHGPVLKRSAIGAA